MSKLTPCLWFDGKAEEAAEFYVSTFREGGQAASIDSIMRTGDAGPRPKGSVLAVNFTLAGQELLGLNGGPEFTFSPAVSLMVHCADQAEVDFFWDRLLAGGEPSQCGWLADKYGFSWQVTPTALLTMLQDPDTARADRVMRAMMQMVKLDLPALKKAYDGG